MILASLFQLLDMKTIIKIITILLNIHIKILFFIPILFVPIKKEFLQIISVYQIILAFKTKKIYGQILQSISLITVIQK